jgi:hypothetical protein|tara:strand:- start:231 stop:638 length:408 start_codon:yes stop_codon:yes gene_type:complete
MNWKNERFGIGSVLRPVGLLLLLLMLVVQGTLPSAAGSASVTDGHAHHQERDAAVSKCPMQSVKMDANAFAETDLGGSPDNAAHCMPSMCCFHDTVASFRMVTAGVLLAGSQIIDRGKTPSSNGATTRDRPPRPV